MYEKVVKQIDYKRTNGSNNNATVNVDRRRSRCSNQSSFLDAFFLEINKFWSTAASRDSDSADTYANKGISADVNRPFPPGWTGRSFRRRYDWVWDI